MSKIVPTDLEFLPDVHPLNQLAKLFVESLDALGVLGDKQVITVLKNYVQQVIEERSTIGCGISFVQEAVKYSDKVVNPRDVILSIRRAIDVLEEGRGIPGFDSRSARAASISITRYMTILVTEQYLTPAFNWDNVDVTTADQVIVSDWIQVGRKKINSRAKPRFLEV